MKIKFLFTICLSLTLVAYPIISKSIPVDVHAAAVQRQLQPAANQGDLRIISAVTSVPRGGIGHITIQGSPGVKYNLRSSTKIGGTARSIAQWRVADASGQVTFVWSVSPESGTGTYPVTIYGGGKTINLSHTVLP